MFTGIIETLGTILNIENEGTNYHFQLISPLTKELKIDQSLAHNGCCLTVVEIDEDKYVVTAIKETMEKTNLGQWKVGEKVNLERCTPAHGRFDGHIVQGHVDQMGECIGIKDENGSWEFRFKYIPSREHMVVSKGSITVNGTSLTVVDPKDDEFSVCIIPYTYEHTVFHQIKIGDKVNLEFDIIGKYLAQLSANY